jgi:hypothetical protein
MLVLIMILIGMIWGFSLIIAVEMRSLICMEAVGRFERDSNFATIGGNIINSRKMMQIIMERTAVFNESIYSRQL